MDKDCFVSLLVSAIQHRNQPTTNHSPFGREVDSTPDCRYPPLERQMKPE